MSAKRSPPIPFTPKPANGPESLAQQIDLLERVLRAQLDLWRRTLGVIDRQREAMRSARAMDLENATLEQQHIAKSLVLLDQQRERLAIALCQRVVPDARRSVPLTQTLKNLPLQDSIRDRLIALVGDLKQTIEAAKGRHSVIAAAADALNKHIAGIQQVVHAAMSRAQVYGRRGKLALGTSTPAAVDMKT